MNRMTQPAQLAFPCDAGVFSDPKEIPNGDIPL